MILARFQFDQDFAHHFIDDPSGIQNIIEMQYDDIYELIEVCEQFKDFIVNCTAIIDGNVLDLRNISKMNASS